MPILYYLDLSLNQLTGTIPKAFRYLTHVLLTSSLYLDVIMLFPYCPAWKSLYSGDNRSVAQKYALMIILKLFQVQS